MNQRSASISGVLYIVATPIGNLADISQRAIQVLQTVDIILAEDTRHSQPLLTHFGIKKPLQSFHAHNEITKSNSVIQALQTGQSFALISDAGTPLISDPGYPLVQEARNQGIDVVPIPGACAVIAALSAAGIPCDVFSFFGFLPAKSKARQEKLASLKHIEHTLVFYESTHRIKPCLDDISTVFGSTCELVLAKELTKTFEQFIKGPVPIINQWLNADTNRTKGEFVVIIPPRIALTSSQTPDHVLTVLLSELPLKQAVSLATRITQGNKNTLYQQALAWHKQNEG